MLVVYLVEWQSKAGVRFRIDRGFWRVHTSDLTEDFRVENLDIECDCVRTIPRSRAVLVLQNALLNQAAWSDAHFLTRRSLRPSPPSETKYKMNNFSLYCV